MFYFFAPIIIHFIILSTFSSAIVLSILSHSIFMLLFLPSLMFLFLSFVRKLKKRPKETEQNKNTRTLRWLQWQGYRQCRLTWNGLLKTNSDDQNTLVKTEWKGDFDHIYFVDHRQVSQIIMRPLKGSHVNTKQTKANVWRTISINLQKLYQTSLRSFVKKYLTTRIYTYFVIFRLNGRTLHKHWSQMYITLMNTVPTGPHVLLWTKQRDWHNETRIGFFFSLELFLPM